MGIVGILMMVIFKFIYVAPFKHLCRGVDEEKWEVAEFALGNNQEAGCRESWVGNCCRAVGGSTNLVFY